MTIGERFLRHSRRTCLALAMLAASASGEAVVVGQIDTFEDGTTMDWFVGEPIHPVPPENQPTGGPTGIDDAYLLLTAIGGSGSGSRLSVLNASQWSGDYLAAGVARIRMDVNNFGPSDVQLRLLFEDLPALPGPPVNLALSAAAVYVPGGSGWTTVEFPITPADLVLETFGTPTGALMNMDRLRIFHNPAPDFPGPGIGIPVVEVFLGVDNILALNGDVGTVPEPPTLALLLCSLVALLAGRRRWQR